MEKLITLCRDAQFISDSRIDIQLDFNMRIRLIVRPVSLISLKDIGDWVHALTYEQLDLYANWGTFTATGKAMSIEDIFDLAMTEENKQLCMSLLRKHVDDNEVGIFFMAPRDMKPMKLKEFISMYGSFAGCKASDLSDFLDDLLRTKDARYGIDSGYLTVYIRDVPAVSFALIGNAVILPKRLRSLVPAVMRLDKSVLPPAGYYLADINTMLMEKDAVVQMLSEMYGTK